MKHKAETLKVVSEWDPVFVPSDRVTAHHWNAAYNQEVAHPWHDKRLPRMMSDCSDSCGKFVT